MKDFLVFLKSKIFLKQLILALGVFVASLFFLSWWLGVTTKHNQKIEVPDLHKKTLAQVKLLLKERDLDFKVIDSASYNPDYPKKSVIEQNPEAGDFVKEKRKIYLTLNPSKYRDITVPSLNGKTKRQATTHLQSVGFKVNTSHIYVPDIGKNVVRGLKHNKNQIKSGDKLPKNSVITLILGDGAIE